MKKGSKIKVTANAKYAGRDMDWTETFTGYKTLDKPTRFLHSSNKPLKSFLAKETCFSTEDVFGGWVESSNAEDRSKFGTGKEMGRKYCYMIELPAGTTVETYSWDEIRVELQEGMELTYVGYYNFLFLDTPILVEKITDPRQERMIKVVNQYFLSI